MVKKETVTLDDLRNVLDLIENTGIRYWLDGGWGVDGMNLMLIFLETPFLMAEIFHVYQPGDRRYFIPVMNCGMSTNTI